METPVNLMHETVSLTVCTHFTDSISAEEMLSPFLSTPLFHFVPAVFRLNQLYRLLIDYMIH